MAAGWTVRAAVEADAPHLAALLRSFNQFPAFAGETPEASALRVARQLAACLADASHSLLVAASPDGLPVGYCAVHWLPYLIMNGVEGYVSELFVLESWRGSGIGTALLDAATAAGRERGASRMSLLNLRDRESYRRGFYAAHGWEERADAANFILKL